MRLSVSVDDVIVELDDEHSNPTLDGIESVLKRMAETAFDLYSKTFDLNSEQVFNIEFTPAEVAEETESDD